MRDDMSPIRIEKKDRNAVAEAARTLRQRLQGHESRPLRAAEASTISGLPLDMAEAALLALHGDYPARFEVDAQGQFTVTFDSLRRRRGGGLRARSWAVLWRRLAPRLLAVRHFVEDKVIFLLMPVLILLLSANMAGLLLPLSLDFPGAGVLRVFPGMLLLLVVGLTAIFALLALVFVLFVAAGFLLLVTGVVAFLGALFILFVEGDPGSGLLALVVGALMLGLGWGWAKSGLETIEDLSSRKKDGIFAGAWLALRGFVFGGRPHRAGPEADALSDERRLTALLQEKRGVLAVRDLITLFGWDLEEAEAALTRILLDYGGDIEVTEEGHLVYVFAAWHKGVEAKAEGTPLSFWDAQQKPAQRLWEIEMSTVYFVGSLLGAGALGLILSQLIFAPVEFLFPSRLINIESEVAASPVIGLGLWPYLAIAGVLMLRYLGLTWAHARYRRLFARQSAIRRVLAEAESGGWYIDTKFASRFGGELDETKGCERGAYFFRFPALQDHAALLRARALG
jgi:hypothetical protein